MSASGPTMVHCDIGKHNTCPGRNCSCRCHDALAIADRFDNEIGGVYGAVASRLRSDHADVVQREAAALRMLDSFDGYDWGDPIRLWTVDGADACLAPEPELPEPEPAEPIALKGRLYFDDCPRCGYLPMKKRKHPLCADCRYVLHKSEWAAWAA